MSARLSGLPLTPVPREALAFWEDAAALARRLGIAGCALVLACTFVWWPVDTLVLAPGPHREGFALLRIGISVVLAGTLAVLWFSRPSAAWMPRLAIAAYGTFTLVVGYTLGRMGPEAMPWFANSILAVMPLVVVPMPLRARASGTAVIAAALAAGFFGASATNWEAPLARSQLSFLAFATLLSVFVGELATRLTWRTWRERQALDEANATLTELAETLSDRVEDRTARLRALAARIDRAEEDERHRIARDLHDDLGQRLTAMRYALARLENRIARGEGAVAPVLEEVNGLLEGTSVSLRAVLARLRPRVLDDLGLSAALDWLCAEVGRIADIEVVYEDRSTSPSTRADGGVELVAFRAVQEALTNAVRHASPSMLRVTLDVDARAVRACVQDDGVGFAPEAEFEGLGIFGMRERVSAWGGRLEITSAPDKGTTVRLDVPVTPPPESRETA